MVAGDVSQKDVALAIFGGGIGLAGLLLIFQGFIVTAYGMLPEQSSKRKRRWYRIVVGCTIGVLACTALSVGASLHWLLTSQNFEVVIYSFWASLVTVVALGVYAAWGLVR